ncbi:MAG: U32 family peptidase [Oscillospiraceae bacterium]|jgi:collagenase-like PrtC family protease|nr:U32 family peptidase [Oscillospiraceae bacterium]
MNYFNIAADMKTETVDQYEELNNRYPDSKIVETFGQISVDNIYGSGRPGDMMPKTDMAALERYVDYSRNKGLGFSYTLNALCLSNREFTEEGLNGIGRFFEQLYEIGVSSLTLAIPALIDFVKRAKYKFEIKASTLCDITNANKALAYGELGADRLVAHESINRDFETLRDIREAFGATTEVIVNVICHKNCIFRPFHQIQGSHNTESGDESPRYYSHKCMLRRAESIDNLLKLNWIRPEDLGYYTDIGINHFKIQGRHTVIGGDPVRTAEAYMAQSYDGNLLDLLDMFNPSNSFSVYIDNKALDGFVETYATHPGFCKNNCSKCGYCMSYAKKCIDEDKANEIGELARRFYEEYDPFYAMVDRYASQTALNSKTPDYVLSESGESQYV